MRITIPYRRHRHAHNTIHADTSDPDRFVVQTTENLEPIIKHCKARREGLVARPDGLVPVAEMPMSVVERAMAEGWFDDDDAIRRWCNDPANAVFRIHEGRV